MQRTNLLHESVDVGLAILILSLLAAVVVSAPQVIPSAHADKVHNRRAAFGAQVAHSASSAATQVRVSEAYGKLPLYFEANQGQTDPRVKFLSRGHGDTLFLTGRGEAVLVLRKSTPQRSPRQTVDSLSAARPQPELAPAAAVVRIKLVGAKRTAKVRGLDQLPGKANYFMGNDPKKWQTNVPTYAKVQYADLYPGIDVTYYGHQRRLESDFLVGAGGDPNSIVLGFDGVDRLEIDAQGNLVLHTSAGVIRQQRPLIYQEVSGVRQEISGGYVLKGKHRAGFEVSAYDRSRRLVIDPVLSYSTYLGGSGFDSGGGIAVDSLGNAYVAGGTGSTDFPTTAGAFQTTLQGAQRFNAFVTKLNPTGSGLVYSTYLGGSSGFAGASAIAVDTLGNAYVTGQVFESTDFPTTIGAFQTTFGGLQDAFVTKLNPTGSGLVYSTYLGGSGDDEGRHLAVDTLGSAYVTGFTVSTDFPTTAPAFQTAAPGFGNAFVTKLNSTGSGLVYSTYLGGAVGDQEGTGIAVDASGNAYVTGETGSTDFPTTAGAFQTAAPGGGDAFVTKLNPTGSGLVYSTYLGGSTVLFRTAGDIGEAIAVDTLGNAYVTGSTISTDFPTTPGAFQPTFGGTGAAPDAFITKLNPLGTGLVYSSYLGGSAFDIGGGISVDSLGNAYVTGITRSTNFPTTPNALQSSHGGGLFDAFVTVVNPLGGLVYSSYLGGSDVDSGSATAVDTLGNAYVTGVTSSANFPTTAGAFQTTFQGKEDAFVTKIANITLPPGPSVGKVSGHGSVNVSGGIAHFGFMAQAHSSSGPISGDLRYVNHASGAKVQSVMFTTFTISGNMATFGGSCTNNEVACTFLVLVQDNGNPGTSDQFTIAIDAGPPQGGTLRHGNIRIRQ